MRKPFGDWWRCWITRCSSTVRSVIVSIFQLLITPYDGRAVSVTLIGIFCPSRFTVSECADLVVEALHRLQSRAGKPAAV